MRFLLARPDHLGDVLLTLPAASALKRAVPGSSVTYLVSPSTAEAPALSCDVDDVATMDFPSPSEDRRPDAAVVARMAAAVAGRFDAAVILRPRDTWSAAIAARARIPVRVGFAGAEISRWLTHDRPEPPRTHAVRLAALLVGDAASALGTHVAMPRPEALVPVTIAEARPDGVTASRAGPVVVHPGSGWVLKNWPAERWARVASALRDLGEVVVVGGPAEANLVDLVAGAAGARSVTSLSVPELAALHRAARVVVSTDNGAVHLAAMVGAPVVALYGPGDPAVAAPWCPADRARIVRIDLACSPCGVMERPPCGALREPACVTGISADEVVAAVRQLARREPATATL